MLSQVPRTHSNKIRVLPAGSLTGSQVQALTKVLWYDGVGACDQVPPDWTQVSRKALERAISLLKGEVSWKDACDTCVLCEVSATALRVMFGFHGRDALT